MASNLRTLQLWRRCLRCCKAMDVALGNYYRGFTKEHILAHKQEDDPARLNHLLGKGEQTLRFVLRKYRMIEPRREELLLTADAQTPRRRRKLATEAPAQGGSRGAAEEEANDRTWTPGR